MRRPLAALFALVIFISIPSQATPSDADSVRRTYAFPYSLILQKPQSDSVDSLEAGRKQRARALEAYSADARANRVTSGVAGIVGGALLAPLGLLVSFSSSLPECDDEQGTTGFTFRFGPCSGSGPSKFGEAAGIGISLSGLALIGVGIYNLSK